jgi:hypothetical protein
MLTREALSMAPGLEVDVGLEASAAAWPSPAAGVGDPDLAGVG